MGFTAGIRQCPDAIVHPSGETFLGWGVLGGGLVVMPTADPRGAETVKPESTVADLRTSTDGGRLVGLDRGFRGGGGQLTGWAVSRVGRPRLAWWKGVTGQEPAELVVAPDGGLVAVHLRDPFHLFPGRLELRYAHDGSVAATCPLRGWCRLLAVRDDGLVLATVSAWHGRFWDGASDTDARLGLLDVERNVWTEQLPLPAGAGLTAALSPDGCHLLMPADGGVAVLAADTLAVRQTYTFPTAGRPTCVAFAPDGLTAACGTSKGEVVIWDVD